MMWANRRATTARLTAPEHRDRGASYIELVMVMAITAVLGTLVLGTVAMIMSLTVKMSERHADRLQVGYVFEEMTLKVAGATTNLSSQVPTRFTTAAQHEMRFSTHAGVGLTEKAHDIRYVVEGGGAPYTLYLDDKTTGKKEVVLSGLQNKAIFEYYTWSTLARNVSGYGSTYENSCFKPIPFTNTGIANQKEITRLERRNQILGILVTLEYADPKNAKAKDIQTYKHFVPIMGNTKIVDEHNDVVDGYVPKRCWESLEVLGAE